MNTAQPLSNPSFQIQRIFLKKQLCELPRGAIVFKEPYEPEIKFEMKISHQELESDIYEVVLALNVESRSQQREVFRIEVEQTGIFTAKGYPAEQLEPLLKAYCPSVLYPYARQTIAMLCLGAGFPAIALEPINFEGLYLQQKQPQATAADPAIEVAH